MADKLARPLLAVPEPARLWVPGQRSFCDPIPLGTRPAGEPYLLPLWLPSHGSYHPVVGGTTGSGKSVLINDIMVAIVPCPDVVIWYIEIAKEGQGAAPWASCIDWLATTPLEALKMLKAARRIIKARMRNLARQAATGKGGDKIRPSRRMPAVFIIIDEAAAMFDVANDLDTDAIALAQDASETGGKVAAEGRSSAVSVLVATQRPSVKSLGNNGEFRSQLFPNICLRMAKRRDVGFVLENVDLEMCDATQLRAPGAMYVQAASGDDPLPIRSYALCEPADIVRLARFYAPHRQPLDAVSRDAAGADYARRPIPESMFTGAVAAPPAPPAAKATKPSPSPAARVEPGSEPTAADVSRVVALRQEVKNTLAQARALVAADEQMADLPAIPVDQMVAGHTAQPAPEQEGDADARAAILAVLDQAPAEGMKAAEVTTTSGVSRAHVYRLLRQLADAGEVHQTGVKKHYRYHRGPAPAVDQAAA